MGIEINENKRKAIQESKQEWRMGLSNKDWRDLLTSICKSIPFTRAGIYTIDT